MVIANVNGKITAKMKLEYLIVNFREYKILTEFRITHPLLRQLASKVTPHRTAYHCTPYEYAMVTVLAVGSYSNHQTMT